MKPQNKLFHYVIVSLILISISGCMGEISSPPPDFEEIIIPAYTKIISSSEFQDKFVTISDDSATFIFKKGVQTIDNLETGDIIVSEVGMGFLRRVIDVETTQDQIILTTEQAVITEAINTGAGSYSGKITPDDIHKFDANIDGMMLKMMPEDPERILFEFPIDRKVEIIPGVEIHGYLDMDISYNFAVSIRWFSVQEIIATATIEEECNIEVAITLLDIKFDKDFTIGTIYITPITFFIGPVPVVITPRIDIIVGIEGEITATITTGMEQSASFTAGLIYSDEKWDTINEINHSFNASPPELRAKAFARPYFGPKLNFLLYGAIGPYCNLRLYAEIDLELGRDPWGLMHAGIDLGMGINMDAISKKINPPHYTIFDIRMQIWESSAIVGTVRGLVEDAVNRSPLENVNVRVYKEADIIGSTTSNSNGVYSIALPVYDNYKVVFSKQGYIDAEYDAVRVEENRETSLMPVLQIDENYAGDGTISGTIMNALDGQGIEGINLNIRRGMNSKSGQVVASTITNSDGTYIFRNIQAGNYTIEAYATGYHTVYFNVISIGGQNRTGQDAAITPILQVGEIRIILIWGDEPDDLDAHFTGPLPDGGRFHMFWYYASQYGITNPWSTIVEIDRDDRKGNGFETITLYQQIQGEYRYFVHDYTNRESTNSYALSNSNAHVLIYNSNGLVEQFNVPTNREGTLWKVFKMVGDEITPLNTFTYESNPGNIGQMSVGKMSGIVKE